MNGHKVIIASFLASAAVITFRDFKQPDPTWPLGKVPPPYRYTWAAVAFGILAVGADLMNEKIPAVIAGGLFLGLVFNVVTKAPSTAGLASNAAAPTSKATPAAGNGTTTNPTKLGGQNKSTGGPGSNVAGGK
jgi:hypothetical protein